MTIVKRFSTVALKGSAMTRLIAVDDAVPVTPCPYIDPFERG